MDKSQNLMFLNVGDSVQFSLFCVADLFKSSFYFIFSNVTYSSVVWLLFWYLKEDFTNFYSWVYLQVLDSTEYTVKNSWKNCKFQCKKIAQNLDTSKIIGHLLPSLCWIYNVQLLQTSPFVRMILTNHPNKGASLVKLNVIHAAGWAAAWPKCIQS